MHFTVPLIVTLAQKIHTKDLEFSAYEIFPSKYIK